MLKRRPRYFPIEKGVYEVAPGLRTLGQDLGNGEADQKVFQLDTEFPRFRESKLACRAERLNKYYLESEFSPSDSAATCSLIVERLTAEYPEHFQLTTRPDGTHMLECGLTFERLELDASMGLVSSSGVQYASAFDALASQVQEDLAVTRVEGERNWLAAIHLCSPSHWAAEDKIGKSFIDIHKPVPGIEKVNQASKALIDATIHKGPYVRFVWGFATDDRPNHHPVPPPGAEPVAWGGRSFSRERAGSPFLLRVERQVLVGLPRISASLFTIRVSFVDGEEIRRDPRERKLLRDGLLSMTPESRAYKGVAGCMDELLAWLEK